MPTVRYYGKVVGTAGHLPTKEIPEGIVSTAVSLIFVKEPERDGEVLRIKNFLYGEEHNLKADCRGVYIEVKE